MVQNRRQFPKRIPGESTWQNDRPGALNCLGISGLPDYELGLNGSEDGLGAGRLADLAQQDLGAGLDRLVDLLVDAGEGRAGHQADILVIETSHHDIAGDIEPGALQAVHGTDGDLVIQAKEGAGTVLERGEPARELAAKLEVVLADEEMIEGT